ncbi:hypothetical protein A0J61_07333 [Choanephora cucurbitarum]|uniref:PH domain-containing protein n=1 Tax=Choanephora cucurbitarum TaxID=101091 RepID=A0A1C7N7L6_9FUNG|nr:hypothetical protein A0J61_07333 [Choanephora cucurbitarum]
MESFTNVLASVSLTQPVQSSLVFPMDQPSVRKEKTREDMLDTNNPETFMPRPNGTHINLILQHANHVDWMTKHRVPGFSLMKSAKKRYIVLVDRILYAFKTETPTQYRSFFILTKDTYAFATDKFAPFCIEIRKTDTSTSWFLQAESADMMKTWLDKIKRTIGLIRQEHNTLITNYQLTQVTTEEEAYAMALGKQPSSASLKSYQSSLSTERRPSFTSSTFSSFIPDALVYQPSTPVSLSHPDEHESLSSYPSSPGLSTRYFAEGNRSCELPKRQVPSMSKFASTSTLPAILPPQLPPPRTQPPPIPSDCNINSP